MSNAELKRRLYLACLAILSAGLLGGFLIYQAAGDEPEDGVSYVVVDGTAYPVAPSSSKRYLRDLQRFGGKGSVLFDEFDRWFDGLWRGKKLAATIACLSVLASLGLFLFARWLPPDRE